MKKIPIVVVAVSLMPIVLYDLFRIFPIELINTDREIYYLLPFLLGIFLADKQILDKLVDYCNDNHYKAIVFISIVLIICSQCIVFYYRMIGNILYAFSIILFGIGIKSVNKKISKGLEVLGKHSMNIFLVHSFYHGYFTICRKLIMKIPTIILKLFTLLSMSLGTSIIIERCKKQINKKIKNN